MTVLRGVLSSFFFHLLILGVIAWIAPQLVHKAPETIEVQLYPEGQILEALTRNKQQVVRQALVPEKLKAQDDENLARLLSEQKQRVKQETQAAKSGMTSNRANLPGVSENRPPQLAGKKQPLPKAKDGYESVDISKELQEMRNFAGDGYSTIGESLPSEVKIGSFTALNTDRYLFYTFYARVEELIRFRWESKVQNVINSLDRANLKLLGQRNWVTQVEFLLDKNGYLRQALLMKESGVKPFDAAAILAFREARVFPNPPPEMVQDDGYIHLKYSFTVNYNPPAMAERN
ncbi:energy transducer TonB family protein [Bdellovibrio reynosensis]|uniref:Energy transducer TonB n=1 Tax=Bdellovibrio reynosensis TaxID=2835041 RepID=A0ABY4C4E1_9BACT|nr:energy transducer TonB [Bdellovibrio reynosensis]UOE99759.1 energy transducer TonB [Bdellovibrio reynosensis]